MVYLEFQIIIKFVDFQIWNKHDYHQMKRKASELSPHEDEPYLKKPKFEEEKSKLRIQKNDDQILSIRNQICESIHFYSKNKIPNSFPLSNTQTFVSSIHPKYLSHTQLRFDECFKDLPIMNIEYELKHALVSLPSLMKWGPHLQIEKCIYLEPNTSSSLYKCQVKIEDQNHICVLKCTRIQNKYYFVHDENTGPKKWSLQAINNEKWEKINNAKYTYLPWTEALIWSQMYPHLFYGNFNVYVPSLKNKMYIEAWNLLFIPYYPHDAREYIYRLLTQHSNQLNETCSNKDQKMQYCQTCVFNTESKCTFVHDYKSLELELAAIFAQVFFILLHPLKQRFGFNHNDCKWNNVVFDTVEETKYEIVCIKRKEKIVHWLKIPYFGKKFQLIDFGWSSFALDEKSILVSSYACKWDYGNVFHPFNAYTDLAQLANDFCYILEINKNVKEKMNENLNHMKKLKDLVLQMACTDKKRILSRKKHKRIDLFYHLLNKECTWTKTRETLLIQSFVSLFEYIPMQNETFENPIVYNLNE